MCGFVGLLNFNKNIENISNVISSMNNALSHRGPDEEGYYVSDTIALGHKRLIVIDPQGGKQPMSATFKNNNYIICYNGQIYNTSELKDDLISHGFEIKTSSDTEILLKSYILYGKDILKHLNGIFSFAIWNEKNKELFIARDHFGIKPFYYSVYNNTFIFSSEIKGILAFPNFPVCIDKYGISELFGIGPAHTPGLCPFKNIYEIKPGHYAIYNKARSSY